MLNVILIFIFVSQSLMYSNFFRLNKPPFLNRQGNPGDFFVALRLFSESGTEAAPLLDWEQSLSFIDGFT